MKKILIVAMSLLLSGCTLIHEENSVPWDEDGVIMYNKICKPAVFIVDARPKDMILNIKDNNIKLSEMENYIKDYLLQEGFLYSDKNYTDNKYIVIIEIVNPNKYMRRKGLLYKAHNVIEKIYSLSNYKDLVISIEEMRTNKKGKEVIGESIFTIRPILMKYDSHESNPQKIAKKISEVIVKHAKEDE